MRSPPSCGLNFKNAIVLVFASAIAFCGDECDRFWKAKGKMAIAFCGNEIRGGDRFILI